MSDPRMHHYGKNHGTSRSRSPHPRDGKQGGSAESEHALPMNDRALQRVLWEEVSEQYVHCAVCEIAIKRDHSQRLNMRDMNATCRRVNCPWPLCFRRECHYIARSRWIEFCLASEKEDSSFFGAGRGTVGERTKKRLRCCTPSSKSPLVH